MGITVAEALKDAGYFTAIVGKWHCGEWLPEHLPMGQGFLHQYGHYAWGIDYYSKTIVHNAPAHFAVYDWHRNQQPLQEEGYTTDLFAAEAERVIASQTRDRPFFLYVAFNAVHGPLNKPPRYAEDYDVHSAMLKCLDDAVGRIVAQLEALSSADFSRTARHPRLQQPMRIVDMLLFHAEHDDYHLARIRELVRLFR